MKLNNIITKIKDFHLNLLSAKSKISSKRYISIIALYLFVATIIVTWFRTVPEFAIYSLVTIILGGSTMTLFQKSDDNSQKSDDIA